MYYVRAGTYRIHWVPFVNCSSTELPTSQWTVLSFVFPAITSTLLRLRSIQYLFPNFNDENRRYVPHVSTWKRYSNHKCWITLLKYHLRLPTVSICLSFDRNCTLCVENRYHFRIWISANLWCHSQSVKRQPTVIVVEKSGLRWAVSCFSSGGIWVQVTLV